MRKNILLCCLFLCVSFTTQAQGWLTDLDEAKKIANEKNQKIILVFQGSDWNPLCIRFEKEMWNNTEFKEYAKEHFVLLKAEFTRKEENRLSEELQEKNSKLKDKYNLDGHFPFVVVLNKEGEALGNTGYKKVSPYMYIKVLNSFKSAKE
jgi:thioredoxin-related protein